MIAIRSGGGDLVDFVRRTREVSTRVLVPAFSMQLNPGLSDEIHWLRGGRPGSWLNRRGRVA